jgi:ectoine hydrolase
MIEPRLNFSQAEFAERLHKTRVAMEDLGVDLLVVTDPYNMNWLTGCDGWSFYVHQCVLVAKDGEPVWYGRGQDAQGARRTTHLNHDNIVGYADHYVQSSDRHPMDFLSQIVTERGWAKAIIGVEMDNYYFSAAAFASLQRHPPNARLVQNGSTSTRVWNAPRHLYVPRTTLQIAGAARPRTPRRRSPNCPLRMRCINSIPAIVTAA